ncbi:heparan sulfate 2-O-sulfotransferase pipe [Daktulosphaira vitifoliae]|uniref:heparan sulfate 2-O-sulfotransferase pipe n=1 Tax=Daktulosphaira vitifoliae TaxID=58002 RepID=UPI0021AA65C1|nr:heparan sulfate 2-O-sulfotransferase pipe [Daktulosphaira vitifoliae]
MTGSDKGYTTRINILSACTRSVEVAKHKRVFTSKRTSELLALMAISSTLFLFLHTRELHTRLRTLQSVSNSASSSGNSASGLEIDVENFIHDEKLEVDLLNNTGRAKKELIFFNRVPKVGSQTFMEILRLLSLRNNFVFYQDQVQRVETIRLAESEQLRVASMVTKYDTPSVFIKHISFLNFTKFYLPEPIYINLVRDPVERVISWYYYIRAPWYYVERKHAFPDTPLPDPNWLKKDFETCVLRGDRECTYTQGEKREGISDHRRQTMFFCGHDEECTPFNSEGALERAKQSVEKHYAVVGVLEDFNVTLTVFEHYIPNFFKGASQVYYGDMGLHKINHNAFKPQVSEAIKDMVRKNFTREIEFYQFCRQRLYKQRLALNL